jgi:glycine/D-amino acid oxidase-like deaminating enzyme
MKDQTLIIGRGIAGSTLSLKMMERELPHIVIDSPNLSASSKVAAGLINPIVLKRLKLVSRAHEYLDFAQPFYRNIQKETGTNILNEMPIAHIFKSIGEINTWGEKMSNPAFKPFLGDIITANNENIEAPLGYGLMKATAWLDTIAFLEFNRHKLGKNLIIEKVNRENLTNLKKEFKHIIICNGHLLKDLYPSLHKAFAPTRGEVMVIESSAKLPDKLVLHGPVFILPLGQNKFKVGATYHWDNLTDTPTKSGLNRLREDLEKILKSPFNIIHHQAGVRPNTKDRQPILGRLEKDVYCMNGLGSRGVLMAPLLAEKLLDHIYNNKALEPELSVSRFI